jgi:outer membrane protein assembly factor BamB
MTRTPLLTALLFALAACSTGPAAESPTPIPTATAAVTGDVWPQFRGPGALGVADGQDLPTEWDVVSGENVRWSAELPGIAHSSPVVWGDRVFVTSAASEAMADVALGDTGGITVAGDEEPFTWSVMALDREDGSVLWRKDVVRGIPRARRHVKATQANATPVTDGETLVVILGSEGLYAFDTAGEPLWDRDLGVLDPGLFGDETSQWGHASSPVIWEDRVLVQVDRHAGSYLAAYSLEDGSELWRVERDEMPVWATPTIHEGTGPDGRTELIVVGGRNIRSYDPQDGSELWRFANQAEVKTPTPFVVGDRVILAGGYRGLPIYALEMGRDGDLSVPEERAPEEPGDALLWRSEPGGPYTTTPLVYGDHVFGITDTGVLSVYSLETGERLHRMRTEETYSASPVASDGKIYLTGENGLVTVVEAGTELSVLATNDMGESCMGTPAIADGTLFFRCRSHLFAVGSS